MITLLLLSFILPTPLGPGSVTAEDDINDIICPLYYKISEGQSNGWNDPAGNCYGSADYDSNENKRCGPTDPGWLTDTDGDGTGDCFDNDDDGDRLTDKYENIYQGYNQKGAADADGITDRYDLVPNLANAARWTVSARDYAPLSGCGDFDGTPDPYIGFFTVQIGTGSELALAVPPGWQQDNHVEDRTSSTGLTFNTVSQGTGDHHMTAGVYDLPESIFGYSVGNLQDTPKIFIRIGLLDHDPEVPGNDPDVIDLRDGSETIALLTQDLATDVFAIDEESGNASCRARISLNFLDNVASRHLYTAIYARNNPGSLITTCDVPPLPPGC